MNSIHALPAPCEHHEAPNQTAAPQSSTLPTQAIAQVQVQATQESPSQISSSACPVQVPPGTGEPSATVAAGNNPQEVPHPQQQQPQMHPSVEIHATEGPSMVLLESLNSQVDQAVQQQQQQGEVQLGSLLDDSLTNQAQQPCMAIQHHPVQASSQQQQQQPHLHQLQPSLNSASLDSTGSQIAHPINQHHQHQHPHQQHNLEDNNSAATGNLSTRSSLMRQRPQIEGIVAEGGGPIVQWLLDNYEIAEGESLPRSTVYNHYLAHCRSLQMASVNAASFGKLIRSVFVGLKTRRLGTRGHSKYHYFGVRAKQHCEQELLQHQQEAGCSRDYTMNNDNSNQNTDNADSENSDSTTTHNGSQLAGGEHSCGRLSSSSSSKRVKRSHGTQQAAVQLHRRTLMYQDQHDMAQSLEQQQQHHHQQQQQALQQEYYATSNNGNGYEIGQPGNAAHAQNHCNKNLIIDQQQDQQLLDRAHCELVEFSNHLGANWSTLVDEHWPQREPGALERQLVKVCGSNEVAECLEPFEQRYKLYYKRMVELLSKLKFMEVEILTQEFWHPSGFPTNKDDPVNSTLWMPPNQQPAMSNGTSPQQQQHQLEQHSNDLAGSQLNLDHNFHHQQHHHLHQSCNHLQQQQSHHPSPHHQHQEQQQQQQTPLLHHHHQSPQFSLTFHQLYQLTSQPLVISRINQIDYHLYDAIESFLLPDMLSPIPRALAQHIRQFAKNIAPWIEMAVKEYEPQFVSEKSKSALAFGSALRRYTSLNHLSTASRAIWDKRSALAQMSLDLSRVDLRDIEHQVSLMSRESNNNGFNSRLNPTNQPNQQVNLLSTNNETGTDDVKSTSISSCTSVIVDQHHQIHHHHHHQLQQQQQQIDNTTGTIDNSTPTNNLTDNTNNTDNLTIDTNQHHNHHLHHAHHFCAMQPAQLIQNFLHLLEHPYPANSWPEWCKNLVESRVCGLSTEEARNFVLKWNFYISLIMKELTLRSAPSFGSFQLIRLLFDEYIFYLVVNRLAQAQHKTTGQLLSL